MLFLLTLQLLIGTSNMHKFIKIPILQINKNIQAIWQRWIFLRHLLAMFVCTIFWLINLRFIEYYIGTSSRQKILLYLFCKLKKNNINIFVYAISSSLLF